MSDGRDGVFEWKVGHWFLGKPDVSGVLLEYVLAVLLEDFFAPLVADIDGESVPFEPEYLL